MATVGTPIAILGGSRVPVLLALLSRGPLSAEELAAQLQTSQPTVSRTIHAAGEQVVTFRVAGDRTPRYGLLRQLQRVAAKQTLYRIDAQGAANPAGWVCLLAGGDSVVLTNRGGFQFDGLPPSMTFASPSGFLGRQVAHEVAAELSVPKSIRDWQDDHRATYLFARAPSPPGDLIFGDACLAMDIESRRSAPLVRDRPKEYLDKTAGATLSAAGSSAGGEQPKFLCETAEAGHVIVKYAQVNSRMAQLLVMEHLALQSLSRAGAAAAQTELLRSGGMVFLEVRRFDRVGRFGRVGMMSAGALDDEVFGKRDSWSGFAQRCVESRFLSQEQADTIHLLAAVSELIGNSDTHFENISLLLNGDGQPSDVAPAYDLLPMMYGSIGGGIDPPLRVIEPRLGAVGGRTEVWRRAHGVAEDFWNQVAGSPDVSAEFRELAVANRKVALEFVRHLMPSLDLTPQVAAPAPPRASSRHRP